MKRIKLGKTDLEVSPICYGTWEIGGMPFFKTPSYEDAKRAVFAALDAGINFIDTAPVYGMGHAESTLGKLLENQDVVLATKCGLSWKEKEIKSIRVNNSAEFIRADIEGSLRRLKKDCIDLYQIHWADPRRKTPIEESIKTLEELKKEGKIRYYGVSNFSEEQLEEAFKYGEPSTIQNRYSILMQKTELVPFAQNPNIAFMAYSPLHRGVLTSKYKENFKESDEPPVQNIGFEKGYQDNIKKAGKLDELAKKCDMSLSAFVLNYTLECLDVDIAIVGSSKALHIKELKKVFDKDIKDKLEDIEKILN